jgi:hypothetical protein
MDDQNTQTIADAEIVDVEVNNVTSNDASETQNQATVLLSLEELIKRHISSIEKLQVESKKHREMFDDAFENSPVYRENAEKAKEAQKLKATTRQEILKQPQMIQLADRIKTMREELRDLKLALSDYLVEFQRLSGLREIQDEQGEFREIINSAKAIKKATKKK